MVVCPFRGVAVTAIDNIPVASTPPGGYGEHDRGRYERTLPPPILADAPQELAPGVPDLRGTWKVIDLTSNGTRVPADNPQWQHFERIEQSGDRVVVTGGGIIHDFPHVDGTLENALRDVMAIDFATPLVVTATFDDGALVLRQDGNDAIRVTRHIEGEYLIWDYSGVFRATMERVDR